MGTFIVFLLKSTGCLAAFYLFYRLLLSRDTFHRFNRVALLGVIVFSVTIPFIQWVTEEPGAIQSPIFNLEQLLQMATISDDVVETSSFSGWLTALFMVYLAGCLLFLSRFIYSVRKIIGLIRSGEKTRLEGGIWLIVTPLPVSPFSWMRYIVISQVDMEESSSEILMHERAHIDAGHSMDMLFAGLCAILHWFNPASWLLKQELQNVHEFEADESVITHGVDAKKYQLLLIKKAVGAQRFTSMANSFNHSKLKKRITMMLRQKSSPWGRLKYLYVLPLAAFAIAAFARPEISRKLEKISEVELSEALVSPQKDKQALKEQARKEKEQAKHEAEEARKEKEISKQQAQREKELMRKEALEEKKLAREEKEQAKREAAEAKQQANDLKVEKLNGEIVKVSVPEADNEFKVVGYGKKGEAPIAIPGKRVLKFDVKTDLIPGVNVRMRPGQVNPLILVDGVEMTGDIKDVDPNTIESISVLKDKTGIEVYGEKAKDGVILITTKKANRSLLK